MKREFNQQLFETTFNKHKKLLKESVSQTIYTIDDKEGKPHKVRYEPERDYEDDNVKIFHNFVDIDSGKIVATSDFTPYREMVDSDINKWIMSRDKNEPGRSFEKDVLGKEQPNEPHLGLDESGDICHACNGSGEGSADGTVCKTCGGSGDSKNHWGKKKYNDDEYEGDDTGDEKPNFDESSSSGNDEKKGPWTGRKKRWDDFKNKNKCSHCNGVKLVNPCKICGGKGYIKNESGNDTIRNLVKQNAQLYRNAAKVLQDKEDDTHQRMADKDELRRLLKNPPEEFAQKNYGSVDAYKKMIQGKIDKLSESSASMGEPVSGINDGFIGNLFGSLKVGDGVIGLEGKFKGKEGVVKSITDNDNISVQFGNDKGYSLVKKSEIKKLPKMHKREPLRVTETKTPDHEYPKSWGGAMKLAGMGIKRKECKKCGEGFYNDDKSKTICDDCKKKNS
jgi:hypothetical protein